MPQFLCMRCRYSLGDPASRPDDTVTCPECGLAQTAAEAARQRFSWTVPVHALVAGILAIAGACFTAVVAKQWPLILLSIPIGGATTAVLATYSKARQVVQPEFPNTLAGYAVGVFIAATLLYAVFGAFAGFGLMMYLMYS